MANMIFEMSPKIQRRLNELLDAPNGLFHNEAKHFLEFVEREPHLAEIVSRLDNSFPGYRDRLSNYLNNPGVQLNEGSDVEAAMFGLEFLRRIAVIADFPRQIYSDIHFRQTGQAASGPQDEMDAKFAQAAKDKFLRPFVSYIRDELDSAANSVLVYALHEVDELTGLPNSSRFKMDREVFVKNADATDQPISFVQIDLDKFKSANDTYGHETGDGVLREFASCFSNVFASRGICYRTGGDEFFALLPNHTSFEASILSERLRKFVASKVFTEKSVAITTSIGVASMPEHDSDGLNLTEFADQAMYDAKKRGKDLVRIYGEVDNEEEVVVQTDRKLPNPDGLTDEMRETILFDYFSSGSAVCPFDQAKMTVRKSKRTANTEIFVLCPRCKMSTNIVDGKIRR